MKTKFIISITKNNTNLGRMKRKILILALSLASIAVTADVDKGNFIPTLYFSISIIRFRLSQRLERVRRKVLSPPEEQP